MKTYKDNSFWTKEKLWQLRQEIVLNSLYLHDYENTFGISEKNCCAFFDGYMSYLSELESEQRDLTKKEKEQQAKHPDIEEIFALDNDDNLWDWFYCFENCPFVD